MLCGLTLSQVLQVLDATWFALLQVMNKRERSKPEWPLGDGETSRISLRGPMDNRIKCGLHGARRERRYCVHGGSGAERCLSLGLIG
jgi:hypothetical protein